MALITSAGTGNFSAGATWTGGVVPGVGDEARASTGHTITIDVDTTCDEVSNAGTGIYTLASGVTLTANVTSKSTTINRNVVQFTSASPAQGFIVGDVTGATVSGTSGAVNNTSSGTLTITGNATGGSGSTAFGCNNASTGTLTITGNATGGTVASAVGCNNASSGTLTITGNATGGSGSTAFGCNNASTGTITITGNATGGSASNAEGCRNASSGTLTITGNATGGSGSIAFGCNNALSGTLTLSGIATGGTTNGAAGANNASSGTLNVGRAKGNDFGIGSTGIAAGFGVSSAQASITKIKEIEYGARGMSPTSGPAYLEPVLGNIAILVNYPSGSGSKTLSDPNNTAGLSPAVTDVRTGVVYNNGNDTGTCAVPAAASVGFGVPVDATTGTAALTPASVWDHLLSAITTSSTIGTLLKTNIDATISSRSTATTAGIADAVWDEVLTGATHNIATSAGRRLRALGNQIILENSAVTSTTNSITFNGLASAITGAYDPALIYIVEGTGVGQCRNILEYRGATKTAIVDRDWRVPPDDTSNYVIVANAGREHVNEGAATGGSSNTIILNASASTTDDAYNGQVVFIRSGIGADQARRVVGYVGSTRTATVDRVWATTPTTESAYVMLPTGEFSQDYVSTAIRTELTPELDEIGEIHAIHGLKSGDALTVTPTSRIAGAISQTISGDGTTTTTVSRD